MKYLNIIAGFTLLSLIISCNKEKEKDDYEITSLQLIIDKNKILDDNTDFALVTITDQMGKDVSNVVTVYVSDVQLAGRRVLSGESGSLTIHAEYNGITSNSETVTVVEDIGLKYDRVVLLEQFTATWCGWCPRAISAISDVALLESNIVHISYHLSGDPFYYNYNQSLFESFGLSGIPAVIAGRELEWDLSRTQLTSLYEEVRIGLSATYDGDASGANVEINVKFGQIYGETLNITAYLIEDGLISDQSNYYNDDSNSPWFGLGDLVQGYSHDNVMRQTLTNMFGEEIPTGSVDIGSEYKLEFNNINVNISDLNNSSLVAFVSFANGSNSDKVINAIVCDLGESAESLVVSDK